MAASCCIALVVLDFIEHQPVETCLGCQPRLPSCRLVSRQHPVISNHLLGVLSSQGTAEALAAALNTELRSWSRSKSASLHAFQARQALLQHL